MRKPGAQRRGCCTIQRRIDPERLVSRPDGRSDYGVGLLDELSNLSRPLDSALRAYRSMGDVLLAAPQETVESPRPNIQINRRLKPAEIKQLVADYEAGASVRVLAAQYQIHRHTAARHLTNHSISLTSGLTPEQTTAAIQLYEQERLSLVKIGKRINAAPNTIRDALLRHGVVMRGRWDR